MTLIGFSVQQEVGEHRKQGGAPHISILGQRLVSAAKLARAKSGQAGTCGGYLDQELTRGQPAARPRKKTDWFARDQKSTDLRLSM